MNQNNTSTLYLHLTCYEFGYNSDNIEVKLNNCEKNSLNSKLIFIYSYENLFVNRI